jgi:amino acid transporter
MAQEKDRSDAAAGPPPGVDAVSTKGKASVSPGRVLVVTSVMLTFISAWRVAAIVLCDLAGTAYYIGGIVESQIGKAAPWFILAVMLFSYAVRSVYIESCSMFVRGGVYRVVKEAMGGTLAKMSVSALLFDYVLTGPISGVSAGQYIVGLANEVLGHYRVGFVIPTTWGSVAIAVAITLYFWRANVRGIRESSDKALKIMAATTVMGVVMIAWCLLTIAVRPETRHLPPAAPDLSAKVSPEGRPIINEVTGQQQDPLGWLGGTAVTETLRDPSKVNWFSLIGVLGILIAFGHSVLAMSGEETLAQVYREVESPKLPNFKKAAFIVFLYSLLLTSLISFFAVMIIPDGPRTETYQDNLIGGLAMSVVGPKPARLALHALVVFVGFLILAGSVNTAIVGSNGVLNRVAEDGVLPAWFLKPHPRYGTTSRLLSMIVGLQLFTIVVSRGDVIVLGEAYAFGVVWSFVFKSLAMLVLRFRRPGPRDFKVPLNVRIGRYDVPVGLALIFLLLAAAAVVNLFTKTVSGGIFTAVLFGIFVVTEWYYGRGEHVDHMEQFNEEAADQFTPEALGLSKPERKLIAVQSRNSLEALQRALDETDPEKTDIVVVATKVVPRRAAAPGPGLTNPDRALLTNVVKLAEEAGKPVRPLVVPTDDPATALARIARAIGARELWMGPGRWRRPEQLIDRIARAWSAAGEGNSTPLTVRIVGEGQDARRELTTSPDRPGRVGRG